MRQHRDFSITVDLEDYTTKFITEAPITRERSRQRQESLTAQELSMLRGVLGTASWKAQQVSPQFAADVSVLLSATAQPVVQDLLDANKLVREMRRSAALSLHFHPFNETTWHQLVFASSWADASDRPRPGGSRTGGYVITLATEKLFRHGQEDDVSSMAWRSFKLPRKIAGSNNGETQALAFADNPSGWPGSDMRGASMRRWHLDEAVRQVGGMLITDSQGISNALTRSGSPQLRLRSSRTGEEARGTKEQCSYSLGQHFDDVGRQSDQAWISRLCGYGIVPGQENDGGAPSILRLSPANVGKQASLFNDDEVNDINPLKDPILFDTLLQDESFLRMFVR